MVFGRKGKTTSNENVDFPSRWECETLFLWKSWEELIAFIFSSLNKNKFSSSRSASRRTRSVDRERLLRSVWSLIFTPYSLQINTIVIHFPISCHNSQTGEYCRSIPGRKGDSLPRRARFVLHHGRSTQDRWRQGHHASSLTISSEQRILCDALQFSAR